ncbi:MAG: DNA-binding protein [Christensenellales bacterium]
MADRIEIGWLFDFYGPLLTERQQKLLALYCNEDFSCRKSPRERHFRQGVYDAVHRAARQLEDYETQLGLLKRYQSMTQGLEEGLSALESGQTQRAKEILMRLLSQEEE